MPITTEKLATQTTGDQRQRELPLAIEQKREIVERAFVAESGMSLRTRHNLRELFRALLVCSVPATADKLAARMMVSESVFYETAKVAKFHELLSIESRIDEGRAATHHAPRWDALAQWGRPKFEGGTASPDSGEPVRIPESESGFRTAGGG